MRKLPKQARSRATVEAVTQAAAQVLGQRGWAGFSTDLVAEKAGVSIGSLYQYFPNKLSLVEAVRQQHFARVREVMLSAQAALPDVARAIERAVDGLFAVHAAEPDLHRVLLEQVPRVEDEAAAGGFEEEFLGLWVALANACPGARSRGSASVAGHVAAAAAEGVVHAAARAKAPQVQSFRAELVALLAGYLGVTG